LSTKIFNGYTLACSSLDKLHYKMKKLGIEARKIQARLRTKWLVKRAVQLFDDANMYGKVKIDKDTVHAVKIRMNPLSIAILELLKREGKMKRTNLRDPEIDTGFKVAILPTRRISKSKHSRLGKIFAIIYVDNMEFEELWNKQSWVKPYGYWDNTDKPDDVSNKAWRQRCRDWEKALDDWKPSGEAGFVYELTSTERAWSFSSMIDKGSKIPFVPSDLVRAIRLAENQLLNKGVGKLTTNTKPDVAVIWKEYKWLSSSEEGKKAVAKLASKLIKKLKRVNKSALKQEVDVEGIEIPNP
jgi:hypothetical protein